MYPGGAGPSPTRSSGAGVDKAMMGAEDVSGCTGWSCTMAVIMFANEATVLSSCSMRACSWDWVKALMVGRTYGTGAAKGRAGGAGIPADGMGLARQS